MKGKGQRRDIANKLRAGSYQRSANLELESRRIEGKKQEQQKRWQSMRPRIRVWRAP